MGRIQGLTETRALTGSQLLKTGKATVFSLTLAWSSATKGNRLYLRDGLDGVAPVQVMIALPDTAGTLQLNWANGKEFADGLFYDEGQAANLFVELTYK